LPQRLGLKKYAYEKAHDPVANLEANYADTLIELATENPGILVGIMIGVATLLVVAVIFCCSSPTPKPERAEQKVSEKKPSTTETKATTTETKSSETQTENETDGSEPTDAPKNEKKRQK